MASTTASGSATAWSSSDASTSLSSGTPSSSAWIARSNRSSGAIGLHERDQPAERALRKLARRIGGWPIHRARERVVGIAHLQPADDDGTVCVVEFRQGLL